MQFKAPPRLARRSPLHRRQWAKTRRAGYSRFPSQEVWNRPVVNNSIVLTKTLKSKA